MRRSISFLALPVFAAAAAFLVSCGSSSNSSMQMATVRVSLSDPATCAAPQGPYSHIYVAVTDVRIHQSSNAGDGDTGWVDLVPGLASNPVQVDLLGAGAQ